MTPERKLIEAVLEVYDRHYIASDTDWLLATPSVQTALAEVRGEDKDTRVCAICDGGPGNDCTCNCGMQKWESPKHEPVLRWLGEAEESADLWLGDCFVGDIRQLDDGRWSFRDELDCAYGSFDTEAEARTAAETAVRDWLKRAGCV